MFLTARISYIRFFTAVQIYEFHISKIIMCKHVGLIQCNILPWHDWHEGNILIPSSIPQCNAVIWSVKDTYTTAADWRYTYPNRAIWLVQSISWVINVKFRKISILLTEWLAACLWAEWKNEHTWRLRGRSFSLLQKQQIKIIISIILTCGMFCETNCLL